MSFGYESCLKYIDEQVKRILNVGGNFKNPSERFKFYHRCLGYCDYAFMIKDIDIIEWNNLFDRLNEFHIYEG